MFSKVTLLLGIGKPISSKADGHQIIKTFNGEFRPTSMGRLTPYPQRENHNTFFTREIGDLRSSRVITVPSFPEKELPLDRMKTSLEISRIKTLHHENSDKEEK